MGVTTGVSATENIHRISGQISSNAEQFVFISKNSEIWIFDVAMGTIIGPPLKHTGTIQSIAISPDNERIASLSDSNTRIRVWDATNGTLIACVIEGKNFDPGLITFSPDGKQIVRAGNNGNIHVWDYTTGLVISYESYRWMPLASISFSLDGTQIICVLKDGHIRTWNYLSNSIIDENMPQDVYSSFATATCDMNEFSYVHFPDGRRIASISRSQMICIMNTATGDLNHLLFDGIDVTIELPTFSPDGMMVGCVIAPDTIHIWNAQTGNAIGEPVKVPTSKIMSIEFSLDGTKLVYISKSVDDVTHSIRIWDIEGAVSVRELHHPKESVDSFFCSPDCTQIIVTHHQDRV
jgi:WD40 repeat protein